MAEVITRVVSGPSNEPYVALQIEHCRQTLRFVVNANRTSVIIKMQCIPDAMGAESWKELSVNELPEAVSAIVLLLAVGLVPLSPGEDKSPSCQRR